VHIHSVSIKNFRALEEIEVEFNSRVNVIVGPNAAGKTTVLEAIRLLRAILIPRTQNEAGQVLQSLGAASPHMPSQLRLQAITRDIQKPVIIGCRFNLENNEIDILRANVDSIANALIQSQVGQAFAAPGALVGFLASPQGKQMLDANKPLIATAISKLEGTKRCFLELTISASGGLNSTADPIDTQLAAFLERHLPPYQTSFTYFPADRALPSGEQPVQLGGPDAQQQLESYNSQPSTKFNRLKNTIFAATVLTDSPVEHDTMPAQFNRIFDGILKGRALHGWGINEIGLLSVLIKDIESNRIFDLDGMSSGEKGLILTFLLIARSVVNGGMVLLDEPELHLNPAVCKDLLSFLIKEYVIPRNLQIIICSHSPEILAGAFDSDECSLYHLISSTNLSKVRAQDEITLNDALKRLGVNESENLLYKGVIFVEGPDDVSLLEAGFSQILRRYKLKFATGRNEVEKTIIDIQKYESEGILSEPTYFIFDKDDTPTKLKNSKAARVLQWDRRCMENYLIDVEQIANLLMNDEIAKKPFTNMGEVSKLIKELAFKQLDEFAARKVYSRYSFDSVGMRKDDVLNKNSEEIADAMFARIEKVRKQLVEIGTSEWKDSFKKSILEERSNLEAIWATSWQNDCDGKKLLEDLSKRVELKMNLKRFKVRLMREITLNKSSSWIVIEGHLKRLLEV
jgi:predicted ATPase